MKQSGRMLQLDLLRGVAIVFVLNSHFAFAAKDQGWEGRIASFWAGFGWVGVDLFFSLSGFLVGGLLFRELRDSGRINLKRFWIRRGFKIWPSYYIFAFVAAGIFAWKGRGTPGLGRDLASRFIPALLNVQNYAPPLRYHLWSLAVEEHFYLALPLLLFWLTMRGSPGKLRLLPLGMLALAAVTLALRILTERGVVPFSYADSLAATHLRIDELAFGALLAYLYFFREDLWGRLTRRPGALLAIGVLLILPMGFCSIHEYRWVLVYGVMMLGLGFGAILIALVSTPVGEGVIGKLVDSRPSRFLAYIGVYSYPIYLWHIDLGGTLGFQVAKVAGRLGLPLSATIGWAAAMLVSVVGGIALSVAVERPMLALRDRWFPSRTGLAFSAGGETAPANQPA